MLMSIRARALHSFFRLRTGSSRALSFGSATVPSSASAGDFTSRSCFSFLVHRPTATTLKLAARHFLKPTRHRPPHRRWFQTEANFHDAADAVLEDIQDAVEILFEDNIGDDDEMPEVNVASGVLTLSMPPHGTWVINKQTPNRQIWWSSPRSGPRRYEYDDERDAWVFTRYIDAIAAGRNVNDDEFRDSITLGTALAAEIKELYDLDIDLK
uniref:Ferroxidase n=1 Tax=Odontella aurita TaxID=265563 RepID=A0A7S4IWV6_9STRA|mmetsp:Transcript_31735/g.94974  ORF Transcript_31735/g.94974 Transcript_31735/m.94974 type:complete len:212 (+) Transcript_31735:142-777(+)|eukprot:CAMPEP_0113545898 /NCGR_PEP_ID=MMETSP0015_2-20120614/11514_1 /TAXON_ID=2838 /ORGANISM="Odontella" /LENGTH=211 /DNA_ID=CAMNT_0000446309 /DNA_START=139 /DNA_END=774 /DNA_ORIENTATION=+ /assembly_acc=CAM_ASM_000160